MTITFANKSKTTNYELCITIIEARHLQQNANPSIVVKVGNQRKKTAVRERTDCPVFNEYFVFDFTCNLDVLLGTKITLAAYLRNCLRQHKLYGSTVLEVSTVWDQPDHRYLRKWAMLMNPKDPTGEPRGYVKCNMMVLVKGEKAKAYPESEDEDNIEGNLLLPLGAEYMTFRQQAQYVLAVYRADGLPDMSRICTDENHENMNAHVEISFAGMKATTCRARRTYAPRFNEIIIFRGMFPPLSYRIRIAVKHQIDSCRDCVVATHILNLRSMSNAGEYGFLPTYGPSFLHLYAPNEQLSKRENSCAGKFYAPSLPFYRGRLLLSLKTVIDDPGASSGHSVETEPTLPIVEKSLWKTEEYLLVAILYDVSMIDRRRFSSKPLSFEISIGNAGNREFSRSRCMENDAEDDLAEKAVINRTGDCSNSQTVPRMTGTHDGRYNYLPIASKKPCMYVKSWWPNLQWRMYNSNNISFIADFLDEKLMKLEDLVLVENPQAYRVYNETVHTLGTYCLEYLHILDTGEYDDLGGTTNLDRQRVNICRKEMEKILKSIKINGELSNNHYIKIAMIHAYKYRETLKELRDDDSLPDVTVSMLASYKRVASAGLSANSIIYSEEKLRIGRNCGKRIQLFMESLPGNAHQSSNCTACTIDLFLWLGNAKFATACWSVIPPGYEVDHQRNIDVFPRYLHYNRSSIYQLRAHVFQGRFEPGMDASGLIDPVASVTFRGRTSMTRVIKQSLDPFWDQTLIISGIRLYGIPCEIKQAPPHVILQVFDQDLCGKQEYCGKSIAVPVVKLSSETYGPPNFPPILVWYKLQSRGKCNGSVLAAFELIQTVEQEEEGQEEDQADEPDEEEEEEEEEEEGEGDGDGEAEGNKEKKFVASGEIYSIPDDIRPKMASYRLEVIFWGVRDMRKLKYTPVLKPRIVIECAGVHVKSQVMENARKFCNFEETHVLVDLSMAERDVYYPSITIKAYDSRGFGCFKYIGVCIVPTVYIFLEQLTTEAEYDMQMYETKSSSKFHLKKPRSNAVFDLPTDHDDFGREEESKGLIPYRKIAETNGASTRLGKTVKMAKDLFGRWKNRMKNGRPTIGSSIYAHDKDETLDWWSKYFASLEEKKQKEHGMYKAPRRKQVATFEIYSSELERQPEFHGFQDRLTTFELWRGKKTGDSHYDSENFAGKFKGHISVYRWPHPEGVMYKTRSGKNAANGLCDDYPSQEPVKLIVRLYVVRAINLHPSDPLSGKSDPYLLVLLGRNSISDRKNYIANQLNPTFGRTFEMEATLPQDYLLTIQVWDHDATSSDDLIGETRIDIENRFYSRHRGSCGIPRTYSTSGYNAWREQQRPTEILQILCNRYNLSKPIYEKSAVTIGKRRFPFYSGIEADAPAEREECMALHVLHRWKSFPICGCVLVPEHLERRPLFNPTRPGLEQGKLELWVDVFQVGQLPLKPAVDITPHMPEEYEIRVIVWNTEKIPLLESHFLTGEKSSDIYVKGAEEQWPLAFLRNYPENFVTPRWILYEDHQKTDVHYNSLTGEGNFNWRFVFRARYSKSERVMIVRKKLSVLARSETEQKLPCRLYLQVWDSDHFSPDDFLGALTLDLSKMPRGSANPKRCTSKILDPHLPAINLFKVSRIRAWWPFVRTTENNEFTEAGQVELEMEILRDAEAKANPAGRGRDPPQSLPPPRRPETSFSWFRNPWRACRFVFCRYYKWRMICCLLGTLLLLLLACAVYAVPGYLVKRLLGA